VYRLVTILSSTGIIRRIEVQEAVGQFEWIDDLTFTLDTTAPRDQVDRAIALSRGKYCSVWHSLRQDIELTTSVLMTGSDTTLAPV
jgi:uncharacterized OsmC-like protein